MNELLVDALEDGKIVKVSESYARREGLMVLRRPQGFDVKSTEQKPVQK